MEFTPEETWAKAEITETLVGRKPGGSAADAARRLRRADPIGTTIDRVLRRRSDERAWRKGAFGERVTGFFLTRLPDGWHVLHDVPIGERGANVDHIVIGPPGVLTINTKNVSGRIDLSPRTLRVNGYRTDFLPKAAHEATRAARLLSAALGRDMPVRGVLAVIADDWHVRERPTDVFVGAPLQVRRWMFGLPPVLSSTEVIQVAGVAHKPSTWKGAPVAEGATCGCGGTLVRRRRRSDGAAFIGCSRFPACRLTRNLDGAG